MNINSGQIYIQNYPSRVFYPEWIRDDPTWKKDFLTNHPQTVTLTENVFFARLCAESTAIGLYTHDSNSGHPSNTIIKFQMTPWPLYSSAEGDESAYREEILKVSA